LLDIAKQHIDAMPAAGLTEKFDESLLLFKAAFGWGMPLYKRENVAGNKPPRKEIPSDVVSTIQENNSLYWILKDSLVIY